MKRFLPFLLALALLFAAPALPAWAVNDLNTPAATPVAVSVLVTATRLIAPRTDRLLYRGMFIQPTNGDIAIAGSGVTATNGIIVYSGTTIFLEWTNGGNWYAIRTGASNVDVRVLPVF